MAISHFHRILRAKIEEGIVKYAEHMTAGGCEDYPTYREAVGVVNGYKLVLKLCEELEREQE